MLYFGHNKNQMGLTIRDAKIKGIDILLKYLKNLKLVDQRNKKSKANIYDSTVYNCLLQLYCCIRITSKYAIAAICTCYRFLIKPVVYEHV